MIKISWSVDIRGEGGRGWKREEKTGGGMKRRRQEEKEEEDNQGVGGKPKDGQVGFMEVKE